MKKISFSIAAIIITAAMLAGCAAPKPNLGRINGIVYASSDIELTFIAPGGWRYLTEEEISEMRQKGADLTTAVSGMQPSYESKEEQLIYDMVAVETETGTSVAVTYFDLAVIPGGTDFTEEDFLDYARKEFEKVSMQNIKLIFSDFTDAEIGPNTYKAMHITFDIEGLSIIQYYYVRRTGGYILTVMATVPGGGDIDSVMANFTWIDGETE